MGAVFRRPQGSQNFTAGPPGGWSVSNWQQLGQRAPEEKALSLIPNQPPFSAWCQSEEPRGPCEQRAGYASCLCWKGLQTRRPWSEESR